MKMDYNHENQNVKPQMSLRYPGHIRFSDEKS